MGTGRGGRVLASRTSGCCATAAAALLIPSPGSGPGPPLVPDVVPERAGATLSVSGRSHPVLGTSCFLQSLSQFAMGVARKQGQGRTGLREGTVQGDKTRTGPLCPHAGEPSSAQRWPGHAQEEGPSLLIGTGQGHRGVRDGPSVRMHRCTRTHTQCGDWGLLLPCTCPSPRSRQGPWSQGKEAFGRGEAGVQAACRPAQQLLHMPGHVHGLIQVELGLLVQDRVGAGGERGMARELVLSEGLYRALGCTQAWPCPPCRTAPCSETH